MYTVEHTKDSVYLKGPGGTLAEIIPACGALLNRFSVFVSGKAINVIDAFENPSKAREQIKPAFQSAKLAPFVCRIQDARYAYNGSDYTLEKFLLNGSAIHGLVFDEPFTVEDEISGPAEAAVALKFEYRGSDRGYPFSFDCHVRYTLKGSSIRLDTKLVNRDTTTIPVADGWHPYFTLGKPVDELEMCFQASQILEFVNLIPTGKKLPFAQFQHLEKIGGTELDNAFVLNEGAKSPACVLRDPESGLQVEISPDPSYPILQIYIPPHRRSIAIENLSGAPDNFNNGIGLLHLQPGEAKSFSTTYAVHVAP